MDKTLEYLSTTYPNIESTGIPNRAVKVGIKEYTEFLISDGTIPINNLRLRIIVNCSNVPFIRMEINITPITPKILIEVDSGMKLITNIQANKNIVT